jgi:transposase
MLQSLSKDISECYLRAEQCKRLAEGALTPAAKKDFLDMERRWLSLARRMNLQNGYRISPRRSAGADRRSNRLRSPD